MTLMHRNLLPVYPPLSKKTRAFSAGQWWHMSSILALGRERQADLSEFEASQVYRASSRTVRVTQTNSVSKNSKRKKYSSKFCLIKNYVLLEKAELEANCITGKETDLVQLNFQELER